MDSLVAPDFLLQEVTFSHYFCMKSYFRLPCNCFYISGHLMPPRAVRFASEILFSLLPSTQLNASKQKWACRATRRIPSAWLSLTAKSNVCFCFSAAADSRWGEGNTEALSEKHRTTSRISPNEENKCCSLRADRGFSSLSCGERGRDYRVLCVLLLVLVGFYLLVFKWGWK